MKYRGDFKKLEKLGYSLDSTEEYYVKQIYKAIVYINTKTKHIKNAECISPQCYLKNIVCSAGLYGIFLNFVFQSFNFQYR